MTRATAPGSSIAPAREGVAALRIFFLHYAYERGLRADAGGFRKLWELARALAALGHEALVFYPRLPQHAPLTPVPSRGYPVLDARGFRPVTAYLSMFFQAWIVARRRPPDIVYFRSGTNVLPPLLAAAVGARSVLEVNADALEFLELEGASSAARRAFAALERRNARHSDRIVAITPGLKAMLVARYGVPPDKVAVVPSGTDTAHFAPEAPAEARWRIGLPPDRPVVGFVGLFYRHQGVPTLLEAIARLRASVPGLLGLIVGDGVMRAAWEARARALGISDAVRFTGQVPYTVVPAYLNAMDVVAAPFTGDRGEASPFKVLDALACARPVVASALPSTRPLAEASEGVRLVPPDDSAALAHALGALLADTERRRIMGERGRAFVVREHSWARIAETVSAVLRS